MVNLLPKPEEVLEPLFDIPTDIIEAVKPFLEPIEPTIARVNTVATLGRKSLEPVAITMDLGREVTDFLSSGLKIPYKLLQTLEVLTDIILGKPPEL